jgi:hypothetical protein
MITMQKILSERRDSGKAFAVVKTKAIAIKSSAFILQWPPYCKKIAGGLARRLNTRARAHTHTKKKHTVTHRDTRATAESGPAPRQPGPI